MAYGAGLSACCLAAGHAFLQFSKTPLFDWLIRFGGFRPVRSLLTRTLANA
jgi:hypothetical protein